MNEMTELTNELMSELSSGHNLEDRGLLHKLTVHAYHELASLKAGLWPRLNTAGSPMAAAGIPSPPLLTFGAR